MEMDLGNNELREVNNLEITEDLFSVYLRVSGARSTGLPLLDVLYSMDASRGLVEVCGEVGSGKTALMLAMASNVLVDSDALRKDGSSNLGVVPAASVAKAREARVLWFDCNRQFRVADMLTSILARVVASRGLQGARSKQGTDDVLAEARRYLSRVDVIRPDSIADLSQALADPFSWIFSCDELEQGDGKRARLGPGRSDRDTSRVPRLVVLDGLGDMLWMQGRMLEKPERSPIPADAPPADQKDGPRVVPQASPQDEWHGVMERLARRLDTMGRQFACPVLWSRQLTFKLDLLPPELREGCAVHGELASGMASALAETVAKLASPGAVGLLSTALATMDPPVPILPQLTRFVVPALESPLMTSKGIPSLPGHGHVAWPCSLKAPSYRSMFDVLSDTVRGPIRNVTWATIMCTRLARQPVQWVPSNATSHGSSSAPSSPAVALYCQPFLVRMACDRKEVRAVLKTTGLDLGPTQASMSAGGYGGVTQGGDSIGSAPSSYSGSGQPDVPLVWECGMVAAAVRIDA